MKNSLFSLILFLINVFFHSHCVRNKAEAIVKDRILKISPESFLNINIKPRGTIYWVSFPAGNRLGYVQFTVTGYEPNKPNELKFYHPITAIQRDIDEVCRVNKLSQAKLLSLMHDKITAYEKIGASQVRGIHSKPFITFQYTDEVIIYYVAHLPPEIVESLVTSYKLQVLNKSWLYENYKHDILP